MVAENRQLVGAVRISDWFNRPLLLEVNDAFNNLARGLATQEQDYSDQFWDTEITQFLFKYVKYKQIIFKTLLFAIDEEKDIT